MPRIAKLKPRRGSTVPVAGTGTEQLDVYELGYRTGTTELYINDNGTVRQLGGGKKTIVHNWAIDGAVSAGDLPPMLVRAPFKVVGIHVLFMGGTGTLTAKLYKDNSDPYTTWTTQVGATAGVSASTVGNLGTEYNASGLTNGTESGTGLVALLPNITQTGGATDVTISVEIEY